LQAAILNVKLNHLEGWTERRKQLADRYDALLSDVGGVSIPLRRDECEHVFHLYVIRSGERDALQAHLKSRGVPTLINYPKALPFYPAYAHLGHGPADFPVAARHQDQILSIPLYPEMTDADQVRVADTIREFSATGSRRETITAPA
jgi:dTDP-4-amino-4,6-dideoxygalactose transaminase